MHQVFEFNRSSSLNNKFLCAVKGTERVLAVANEEGIVRLYNTERCENPILKGEFTALPHG